MAQILPDSTTATSPPPQTPSQDDSPSESPLKLSLDPIPRTQKLAHRLSSYSQSQSRQTSAVFPLFHSSLPYSLVRDFAYPPYNPMHYGPTPEQQSLVTSPDGEYDGARRVSDPPPWDASAGPWRDSSFDSQGQQLPSTSFGLDDSDDEGNRRSSRRISKHRKSKSYADMEGYTRGRRRSSKDRRSRAGGGVGFTNHAGGSNNASAQHYVGYFAQGEGYDDRNDSAYSQSNARQHAQHLQVGGIATTHPPFREDSDTVPYSPSALEDHRPESASLDEAFAGPSLALYDFHPENDNELPLREGQVIQVGYRHGQGWLVAMNIETGEQGLVPEEYVRLLRDIEGGWPSGGVAGDDVEDEDLIMNAGKGKGVEGDGER